MKEMDWFLEGVIVAGVFENEQLNSEFGENKGLISIIIPAYNAEKWIQRSVKSALAQTYSNVEVLVIENGSADSTTDVVLAIKDDRLRLFHSEKGVSNARNMGIDNSKGEFLTFLDADDWLADDAIEKMAAVIEEDVALVSARYFDDKPFENYSKMKYAAGAEEYILKCLYTPTKRGNAHGNLYRSSIIKENGIRFEPLLTNAEDSVFFFSFLMKKLVVVDLEEPVYHIYYNPESVTRTIKESAVYAFAESVSRVYDLLSGCSEQILNGGYIFALNQILVILVNSGMRGKNLRELIRRTCNEPVFQIARENVDLTVLRRPYRVVFGFIKKRRIIPLSVIVRMRSKRNSIRK